MRTGLAEGGMSEYERKAWDRLIDEAQKAANARSRLPEPIGKFGRDVGRRIGQTWEKVPGHESAEAALAAALAGLQEYTTDIAMRTVGTERVLTSFAKEYPDVNDWGDIRRLDLKACDARVPHRRGGYGAVAGLEGAATSLAVTGAVVSSTVSGGTTAAVAIGAVATDVTAMMAGMGRIVAVLAAQYGYDVREPEEEVFALGVIGVATAAGPAAKTASMASLSRLTQEMMRRATWTQLRRHGLVNLLDRLYAALGLRLTQAKLAQAVPVAGVVINSGLNIAMVDRAFRNGQAAYRMRFLCEKYGLDPTEWMSGEAPRGDATPEGAETVDGIIDDYFREPAEDAGHDNGDGDHPDPDRGAGDGTARPG